MKVEQKVVAVGAASGVLIMILSVWGLMHILHVPNVGDTPWERLSYALKANVFALVPLFVMLMTVGNSRFLSKAIDPTRHAESKVQEVNGRVADNTFQQNFIFFVASLALSILVPYRHLAVIWAAAIVFVVARCIFWLGYRIHPLYRAPGMSATAYLNLGMILYVLYRIFISVS